MSELRYTNLTPELAPQCAELELLAFPHADPQELISLEDFQAYARVFPEGFFVCLDGDRVVVRGFLGLSDGMQVTPIRPPKIRCLRPSSISPRVMG